MAAKPRPIPELVAEAEALAAQGVRELNLIGQLEFVPLYELLLKY